jgi:hypothetical protein
MAQVGYCGECRRYVELTASGECPAGHPRSALRDVREGSLAEVPAVAKVASERRDVPAETTEPVVLEGTGMLAKIIGWGIVLVPVLLVLGWGLWAGYDEAASHGASGAKALMISAGSLVLTGVGTFVWIWIRRRRH